MDNKGQVKVTIATVSYNSSKYIRHTIDSVLAQSFTDFEYLISDDCSTDGTWAIINRYSDPRIRAWKNESNLREYANRNKTLQEAKGEYIIWIDGDDILYPHGLEFMIKMLDAFPNSAMACARPYWPNMVYPYELLPTETYKFDYLGSPVTVNGFTDTLFRKEILLSHGGLPTEFITGDTFVKKKISAYHPILLISNGVSWWRMPQGQASSKIRGTITGVIEALKIDEIFLYHKDCPLNDDDIEIAKANIYAYYYRYLVRNYLLKGKISSFIKYIGIPNQNLGTIVKYTLTQLNRSYTMNSSPELPLIRNFNDNPYSK